MNETIQGYFFGLSYGERNDDQPIGLAGFAIPDLGIVFRSRWEGSLYQCQYAGLLSLLRFIEMNSENFADFEFEILSDSTLVVNQVAHRLFLTSELAPYYRAAVDYKNKVNYRISWVPRDENAAIAGWGDIPPLKPDIPLNLGLDLSNDSKRNTARGK